MAANLELLKQLDHRTTQLVKANLALKQETTARKRFEKKIRSLENQLCKSKKMAAIGTLAGGVAHDLNNILSGLVSYPELLLLDLPEDSALRQPIKTIQESGRRAAAIVQDLLTLTRRVASVTAVINLNQLIGQYLNSPEHSKILEYTSGIKITARLQEDLLNILGSPVHLSKSLMNLVSNAAEAMPTGGEILITSENCIIDKAKNGVESVPPGRYVALRVSDAGIGISPEDIKRIFEPFYTSKTMGRSGTGLGMAVVWGTVKDHNGYIDIKSDLGRGTTITMYFPVTQQALPEEKPRTSIDQYKGRGESILIVDDMKEQRKIASEMLKKLDYKVVSVPSGEEALRYVSENHVDLLVLDMIMNPGINGLETYKKILQFRPRQKAVIASGYSESDLVREAQHMGAGAYVKKPYSFEKIGLAIKSELSKLDVSRINRN